MENLGLDELIEVREHADKLIAEKLVTEKRVLRQKLARIAQFETERTPSRGVAAVKSRRSRSKVVPKYRDPASGATWSGRGKIPKWMMPLIEAGAQREDFRIHNG